MRSSSFSQTSRFAMGVALLSMLGWTAGADAKTLYVNAASGNDATTYDANSASAPWRTISRAAWGSANRDQPNSAQAARAGDLVLVAAGVYTTPGPNSRNMPAYQPANSGSAGALITFRAQGTVTLRLSSGFGSVIGSFEKHYVVWDGFTIHEASAPSGPDTGSATIWLCNGCAFYNLDINGNGDANARMDNHTGIRVEASSNIHLRNNRIQNVHTAHNPNNGAGIMTYSSRNLLIENNEIFDCGSGVFIKGGFGSNNPNGGTTTIRYNHIYNIGEVEDDGALEGNAIALHVGAANTAAMPLLVYQNIIRNVYESGIKLWMFDGVDPHSNPMHNKIVNNTMVNVRSGVWVTHNLLANAGHVFWNNIVTNMVDYGIVYGGTAANLTKSRFDSEHNLFFTYPTFAWVADGGNMNLATWSSRYGQDAANPRTVSADPLFMSASDFRLQTGSPARTLGVDWLDLDGDGSRTDVVPAGAYVTGAEVIGRTTGASPPPPSPPPATAPPQAPTNLRIIS